LRELHSAEVDAVVKGPGAPEWPLYKPTMRASLPDLNPAITIERS
jgi:hypothetical protein